VAPCGDSAQAGEIGDLRGRRISGALLRDAGDEVGGRSRQALGKCLATALSEDGVKRIDGVLVRLRKLLESLVHGGVALQLLLKSRESKRLDQVVDEAAVHRGP